MANLKLKGFKNNTLFILFIKKLIINKFFYFEIFSFFKQTKVDNICRNFTIFVPSFLDFYISC